MRPPPSLMPSVFPAGTVFISRTNTPPSPIPLPPPPSDQRYQIPQIVLIVIIVLTSIFLSVTCYVAFAKHCPTWTRILNWTNRDPPASDHRVPGDPAHNHAAGEQVDHPVWLMTSVGLQPSVINSIQLTRYKSEEGVIEGTDCSVCLAEFQEDDALRILPKCNHAFHVICIDTWLGSHTNCPLCRADVVVVASPRPCLGSNEPRLRQLRWGDLPQMEDSDSSDVDEGNNQTGSSSSTGNYSYEVDSNSNNNISSDQSKGEDGNSNINSSDERMCFSLEVVHGSNSQCNASSSSFRLTSSLSWSPLVNKKRSYSWSEKVH